MSGQTMPSAPRLTYLTFTIFGLVSVTAGIILRWQNDDPFPLYTLIVPGIALRLAAEVLAGILLFRSWRCIERHKRYVDSSWRAVDPGAAVAMTYIPGVNFVGLFISLGRLPGSLNRLARAVGVMRRAPEHLGYVVAVMIACGLIPDIGWVISAIAGFLLLPWLIISCSSLADSIEGQLGGSSLRPV